MRLFRVFFFFALIPAIAGCAGMASDKPTTPTITIAAPSEFLFLGTSSRPGLVEYGITLDGVLHPFAIDSSVPAVCSPQLSLSRDHLFSVSQLCPSSPSQTELRRYILGDGNILFSTSPLSLPNLPSASGFALNFITGIDGKLGYVRSIAPDGSQHISPVEIGQAGDLTVMPDLGISWPFLDPSLTGCTFDHIPDAVVQTPTGPYLSVRQSASCSDPNASGVAYELYKLDPGTGAIGIVLGEPPFDRAADTAFATYNGALLVTGETHSLPDFESGKLNLFRIDPNGNDFGNDRTTSVFLQACMPDQPACAHPVAGIFHPSGKWLFIADRHAGGIWTIPVSDNSMSPEKASFLPATLLDDLHFVFSSTGKFMYIAQSNGGSAETQGFQVDPATGALSTLKGSPWLLGNAASVSSIINVPPTNALF